MTLEERAEELAQYAADRYRAPKRSERFERQILIHLREAVAEALAEKDKPIRCPGCGRDIRSSSIYYPVCRECRLRLPVNADVVKKLNEEWEDRVWAQPEVQPTAIVEVIGEPSATYDAEWKKP